MSESPQLRQAPLWGSDKCRWLYSRSCARPPSGGQTNVAGSTAAAAPGPPLGVRQMSLVLQPLVLQPQLRQAPLWGSDKCRWIYSRSCARPPSGGQTNATGSTAAAAPGPPLGVRTECNWFYSRSCARPPSGGRQVSLVLQSKTVSSTLRQAPRRAGKGLWFYSRSCARPPEGQTKCLWFYGVEPLVLPRARPPGGQTNASGSTE
jgi:hypothetical protein